MKKKNVYALAFGALMAVLPGQAFPQAQATAALSGGTFAEAAPPPFCVECQWVWWGHQQDLCWAPICNAVEPYGYYHCLSWFENCYDNGCVAWEWGCTFFPFSFAPDGSVRAPQLTGLSYNAIAALLGTASADNPILRRPCDQAVVVRRVDAMVAFEQRRKTSRIVI